ncbi:MAG: ATP-binding protein, partial [Campylobacterales bacterium]
GYLYRQDYLEQIREKGEATVTYSYLKPDTRQPAPKISYLYHLKEWNWIIAAGFYLDDLQPVYESEKAAGEALIKEQLIYSAFGVMTIVALVAALYLVAHRQIQASFRGYEDRIRAQNRTLLEQERRLSENAKIVAAGEIIKRVAHHWRQPLNAIGILIQDLIEAKKSGELNDSYLENNTQKAMGIINRMSHTIDQFRGFLNDEKEGVFDADKMVDQALILLRPELEEANILWQKAGGGEPLRVRGSSALFGRALLGLIVNAKEALQENPAKKSGEIALLLKKNGSRAQLIIEDNGPGIRDELKAQLFMPYVSTKGPGQGRGLGLYTARETIEAMGGTLQIESTGEKTRAVIDLPLV